jgi:hypothetical protein
VHGAHGYLISEFLSPRVNLRTDKWGGDLKSRARFLFEVLRTIRKSVGPDFPVGLKLKRLKHRQSLQLQGRIKPYFLCSRQLRIGSIDRDADLQDSSFDIARQLRFTTGSFGSESSRRKDCLCSVMSGRLGNPHDENVRFTDGPL